MNTQQTETPVVRMMLFQGPNFILKVPSNWLITASSDAQVTFLGPKISTLHAGFGVHISLKKESEALKTKIKNYNDKMRSQDVQFELTHTKDLSNDQYEAYHQVIRWVNPEHDLLLEQHQVYIEAEDAYLLLSTSQPVRHDYFQQINELMVEMLESFRVGKLDL